MSVPPSATVVIVTKNRKALLMNAIRSAVEQTIAPEVIVIDDGSTDGTPEAVSANFPHVRLVAHEHSRGYIVRRNEGVALASSDVIFSIDDDAVFGHPETIATTLQEFDDERIWAVAIPFVNVNVSTSVHQDGRPFQETMIAPFFIGTAHALRRNVFLELGGYDESLVHQGEEGDICLRALDKGHLVRLGRATPIRHFESPIRNNERIARLNARNAVGFCFKNAPMPEALVNAVLTTAKLVQYQRVRDLPLRPVLSGIKEGWQSAWALRRRYRPVRRRTFWIFRALKASYRPLSWYEDAVENASFADLVKAARGQ
jgi:glycosyltransferase involved in cell wall biosynthesis